jgi:hypothetical protein
MNCLLQRVVLILVVALFLAGGDSATAGNPVGDFFKRLGNSIAHPQSTPPPSRRKPRQVPTARTKSENEQTAPQNVPPAGPLVPPVPAPAPAPVPTPTPMPVSPMVRSAAGVPPSKRPRRDLPYGIPLPNKPGFVTSPYAPKSGFVDVRGFPSGTEVNDPYTGKTFLTP